MKRWPTKPLWELVLPTEQRDPRENPTEEFSYVDIAGVDNEAKIIVSAKRIVGADAPSRARKVIRKGDVIVSTVRPNLNAVALIHQALDNQICSTGFSVLRASEKVMNGYLFAFVRSPSFIDYLVARTTGANYPAVNDGEVKDVPVPVPPLAEQERIVKLLDEADELRKLRAQADHRTAALMPALFHEMFGDPTKNTSCWSSLPLGEVVSLGSGATPSKENPEYWNGRTPWVSPKDMKADEITDAEDHVTAEAFEKTNLQLIPKDTVLIVVRGMILAHTVPIRRCRVPVAINQDMKALLPKKPMEPEFLRWSLQAQHAHLLTQVSTAGHGTKKLDSEKLQAVTIPFPPLPLQKEFADRVAEIREVEAAQAASRQRLEALFQSILHRAFNGEL